MLNLEPENLHRYSKNKKPIFSIYLIRAQVPIYLVYETLTKAHNLLSYKRLLQFVEMLEIEDII